MIHYKYKGITQQGKRVRGVLQAENECDLEKRLLAAEVDLLSYKVKGSTLFSLTQKRISKRDVIVVTSQIRQLLRAGISLMEIVGDLKVTFESEVVRGILADVYESMESGDTFSESLKPYQREFGKVYISLIAVGERTGQLEMVLKRLEDGMKWEESLSAKAKKVMVYPAIVTMVVLAVVVLLMVFVVPELLNFITEMDGELGFATIALIAVSGFIQENLLALFVFPFGVIFIVKWQLKRSVKFRLWFDKKLFKIKVFGPILYNLKIAKFTNSLAVMFAAGIGFIESMNQSSAVVGNTYVENNIKKAMLLIEEGASIYEAFSQAKVLPPMGNRIIKVGEISGKMDEALIEISEYYDNEAKESIERIEPAIEPLLTVVMGLVVAWIMIAVLGPIYDTVSKV